MTATTGNEDTAITTNVLANDTFEGTPVVTAVTDGANGTVINNGDGTVTYTPNADFNGTDSYTYTVTSGGVTETATVNVTVNAVVDIANDTASGNEDTAITTNVLANDTFEGSPVVTAVTDGANGTVVNNGDGTVTYTANADFNGTDSYSYTVTSGGVTETATVNVTVNPVVEPNQAPVAKNDVIVVSTSTTTFLSAAWLLANDIDGDGDQLSITAATIGTLPSGWTITPVSSGGVITGFNITTSSANSANVTGLSYTVTDGQGNTSNAQFSIQTPGTASTPGGNNIDLSASVYNYSYVDAQAQGDTVTGSTTTSSLTLAGSLGNDIFVGAAGNDTLNGNSGEDVLRGGTGDDTIDGGSDIDLIDFSDGTAGLSFIWSRARATRPSTPPLPVLVLTSTAT